LGKLEQGVYNNSADPISDTTEFDDCDGLTPEEINGFYGFDSNGEPLDSSDAESDSIQEDDADSDGFDQSASDEDEPGTESDPLPLEDVLTRGHDFDTEVSL
jgi:hypothetical protein